MIKRDKEAIFMKRFAIVLAIVVAAYMIFFNPIHLPGLPFGKQQGSATSTVTEQVNQMDIKVGSIKTEVVLGGSNQVHAKLSGKGSVSVQRSGNSIQVKAHRQFTFFSWWDQSKVTITIPRSYAGELNLDVGSGTLHFDGDAETKYRNLSVNVSSGSINLSGIDANSVQADVQSGNLRIDTLNTATAKLEVSSGNLHVTHFSGTINAQVHSGNLKMDVTELSGPIKATVNSGFARINLPNSTGFRLNGKTSSGLIQCALSLKEKQSDDKTTSGVHGSGKYNIDASVNSGLLSLY
jgi:lia operon protein LiaG